MKSKALCLSFLVLGLAVPAVPAASIFTTDFSADDGGFTVNTPTPYDGPWTYRAGTASWGEDGQQPENSRPNTSMLNSPTIIITTAGEVTLSFDHRHSLEGGRWDGGQVRLSVNGGAYATVPGSAFLQNGYNGTVLPNSASVLAGQSAFVETSAGYASGFLTSVAELGSYNPGDSISVQFIVGNDTNTRGPNLPNWEIGSFTLSGPAAGVPEVTNSLGLLMLGLAGVGLARRYSAGSTSA